MRLYRVFNYDASAAVTAPGGATYRPALATNRLDNPAHYALFYAAREPEGAIAEALHRGPYLHVWNAAMLRPPPFAPATRRALATYELPDDVAICNLDDGATLATRKLRPSAVVTRDYAVSQAWALAIYRARVKPKWAGIGWWSRHDSRWSNVALWNVDRLLVSSIDILDTSNPALRASAAVLEIPIA